MKHTWTLLLLFILLGSAKAVAQETADLQVKITTTEDLRIQLAAENKTGKKLYLSVLMKEDGATFNRLAETEIYSEEISGELSSFSRVLNLSKLESGTYRISVKAGKHHVDRFVDIKPRPVVEDTRIILVQ
ncbi:MAG: hypothetical protein JNM22_06895 [Saprospiraceae bacterium]|nr:hypothetical protein [Saprospiraceae bacterium]